MGLQFKPQFVNLVPSLDPKAPQKQALVTLVGAGPGDPELITRKGLRALQSADAVLYDALVSPELLAEAPSKALKIFVGKRAGSHYKKQAEINALLVQTALEMGHVVRLKGGDPFVFGRGYEEKTFVESHGISVNVVPGISSTTSLAGLQGVPVTSRGYADSFWVLTAHTRSGGVSEDLQLAAQSSATVIVLMGLRRLEQICALYTAAGKRDLPVMVIQNGSCPDEQCWMGTVADIATRVTQERGSGPGIIVIGKVVALHPERVKNRALHEAQTPSATTLSS